jgi:hypothetical protein
LYILAAYFSPKQAAKMVAALPGVTVRHRFGIDDYRTARGVFEGKE